MDWEWVWITLCIITKEFVQFSHSVMSDSLQPHGLQHARPPCPSPTPGACSNSCPSSQWCIPFSSCLQSFPAFVLESKCWDASKDFKEGQNVVQFFFFILLTSGSQPLWHLGMILWKTIFPGPGGGGWPWDIIQAHCIYCALCFCYYCISSTSDHQTLDPGGWHPLLWTILAVVWRMSEKEINLDAGRWGREGVNIASR